jgi:hypothetical protein
MATCAIGNFGAHNIGDDLLLHVLRQNWPEPIDALTYSRRASVPDAGIWSMHDGARLRLDAYDTVILGPGGVFPGYANIPDAWIEGGRDALRPESLQGKRVLALGVGWFPLQNHMAEQIAIADTRMLLKDAGCVLARDARMAAIGGAMAWLCPDLAYGLAVDDTLFEERGRTVVVCPNVTLEDASREVCARAVADCRSLGLEPLVVACSASFSEVDAILCHEISRATGAPWYPTVLTWQEFLPLAARAHSVLTLRKHAAVMAQLVGTPSVVWDGRGAFAGMQEVAGGYSVVEGGLGSAPHLGKDVIAALPGSVPSDWRERMAATRERVVDALAEVAQNNTRRMRADNASSNPSSG